MQTQFCSGLRLKSCDDFTPVVCMDMTNVADRYGLNLLDLLMSEVRVFLLSLIFSNCCFLLRFDIPMCDAFSRYNGQDAFFGIFPWIFILHL